MDVSAVDYVLTTTRSVRRRLDLSRPVERSVIEQCIEIAVQAPNGSNANPYHFMVVTDAAKRAAMADIYRRAYEHIIGHDPEWERSKVGISSKYLADHLQDVPVLIIPCVRGRLENPSALRMAGRYGSILPAVWSLMLALRARGLGSAWTTAHIYYEAEVANLLGIPHDVTQVAMLPVAYTLGTDFKRAARVPARERTYWDSWGKTG